MRLTKTHKYICENLSLMFLRFNISSLIPLNFVKIVIIFLRFIVNITNIYECLISLTFYLMMYFSMTLMNDVFFYDSNDKEFVGCFENLNYFLI